MFGTLTHLASNTQMHDGCRIALALLHVTFNTDNAHVVALVQHVPNPITVASACGELVCAKRMRNKCRSAIRTLESELEPLNY